MNPALTLEGLSCRLQNRLVLDQVRFTAQPGELIGLIGPNGSGKSTLLRCLAGLVAYQGGLRLQGREAQTLSLRQRAQSLAFMAQSASLEAPFPVREVVRMGRWPYRQRRLSPNDQTLIDQALEWTGTTALADTPITQLSGGERQRVFLAKTLAQDTPIVLLDEPTASLDLAYQEQIFALARRLADAGKTVLVAVHDLRLAARVCTRLALLAQGQLIAQGSAAEVLTAAHLDRAYGIQARVFHNSLTGLWDFHWQVPTRRDVRPPVHVIGGGGSATSVLRLLSQRGYPVTTGVLSPADSDLQCAGLHGIPVVTSDPYSEIPQAAFQENCELAAHSALTILCNLFYGQQNLRNLEAARFAQRLIILEDDDPALRDFSGGAALALYRQLKPTATVLRGTELEAWLSQWEATVSITAPEFHSKE